MTDFEIQVLFYLERIDAFLYNYLFPALIVLLLFYIGFKCIRRKFLL